MKIIAEAMETTSGMVDYIFNELTKCIHLQPHEEKKINLSLDLNNPAWIMVKKDEVKKCFDCNWFGYDTKKQFKITGDIFKMKDEIKVMLQAMDKIADQNKFQNKCYKAYQLDWMMSHGYALDDVIDILTGSLVDQIESDSETIESGDSAKNFMQCAREEFEEQGFAYGHMYVCFDEFLKTEYLDAHYMKHLLQNMSDSKGMKAKYAKYTGKQLSAIPELSVNTNAGTLNAYPNLDPERPGICILLQPKDYDTEIDVCMTEVCQAAEENRTTYDKGPEDVRIICWSNATKQDYTDDHTVKREDIIKTFEGRDLYTPAFDDDTSDDQTEKAGLTFKYKSLHEKAKVYRYKEPLDLVKQYDDYLDTNVLHDDFPPMETTYAILDRIYINGKDITKQIQEFTYDRLSTRKIFLEDLIAYLRENCKA